MYITAVDEKVICLHATLYTSEPFCISSTVGVALMEKSDPHETDVLGASHPIAEEADATGGELAGGAGGVQSPHELRTDLDESCTGSAQIARLGPTLVPKVPTRALKLAHNLGHAPLYNFR